MRILMSPLEGTPFVPIFFVGTRIYLILFSAHAFVLERQERPSWLPSLSVFRTISTDFTPTPCVPPTLFSLYLISIPCESLVEPENLT